jgi:nitroreductase
LFGLSLLIPKQSAEGYRASAAFGAIIITGYDDVDFLTAGRAFERLWLTATKIGISIQPVTALPYLMQRVRDRETESLSSAHVQMIADANNSLDRAFDIQPSEHIAMLFRLGYAKQPSARSAKMPPIIMK